MKVYKCDRCGKVYVNTPKSKKTVSIRFCDRIRDVKIDSFCFHADGYPLLEMDLCQDCIDEFCAWYSEPIDYNITEEDVYEY